MNGWYRQQRNLFERPWAGDPRAVQLYVFLKERAYVQDRMFNGIIIRRGSCPTTWSEMMETTGMTRKKLDLTLKTLKSYGEIIVKGYCKFSVITVCDYDSYNAPESLFGTAEGTAEDTARETAGGTAEETTHISYKEGISNKEEDNLRSLYNPSKNEREKDKGLIYEIKKLYNKKFEGVLPEWKRLSDKMAIKVSTCITRYGRQSVDMVFDQVLHEKFSLGQNKTGFIADFDFIFRLNEYEKYLSRYELRLKRKNEDPGGEKKRVSDVLEPQQKRAKGSVDAHEFKHSPHQERKSQLEGMVGIVEKTPDSWCRKVLIQAFESGELQELGIDWQPNKQQAI